MYYNVWFFLKKVGGLMNGSIKVFNVGTGTLNGTLENDETINEAMPISRIRQGVSSINLLHAFHLCHFLKEIYVIKFFSLRCRTYAPGAKFDDINLLL